jgi:hypothetical protein
LRSVDIEEIGALGTIFLGRLRFEFLVRGEQISDSRSQRERERETEREKATGHSVGKTLGYALNEAGNYMGRPNNMSQFL